MSDQTEKVLTLGKTLSFLSMNVESSEAKKVPINGKYGFLHKSIFYAIL